ncbi:MAG TPA: M13 family peptidase, partial [Bryobacterales bacterium]|nr:M13 family peptidase [Bryobacterales bacterium]
MPPGAGGGRRRGGKLDRMRITKCLLTGLLAAAGLSAQEGFSTAWIDASADPCVDFYQYACGEWVKKNPIPPDQARWTRFQELAERNREILRKILEKAAAAGAERSQIEQQIGDYYAACMDEEAIEKKGLAPLEPELERIRSVSSKAGLPELVARLHRGGANVFFRFGPMPSFEDSEWHIADVDQGGLGLPERDYYFREDAKSKELREAYVKHVARMFELLGDEADAAEGRARTVMRIETALAKGSLDVTSRRDPKNIWHKKTVAELAKLGPSFDWKAYFRAVGAPQFEEVNVDTPEFIEAMDRVLRDESLADIKTYLTWQLLRRAAPLLPKAFVEENFNFYRKTLAGAKQMRPRWKRCVAMVDRDLGEALGQAYVAEAFPPESKQRMLKLVAALEKALEEDIKSLPWMTGKTKEKALEKLHAIRNKIGYPDKWRDYSKLRIADSDALGNYFSARAHELAYQLAKIGKRVDPNEWHMTPPTVNAYYHPLENNINFPAGILQPPFFDPKLDDAPNYGAIGGVIGHELTHGFDDMGRKFDAEGNLKDWWTPEDAAAFEKRAQCFVEQYSAYTAVDGVKVNGKLTLGENVADNGGLRLALMALQDVLSADEKKRKI